MLQFEKNLMNKEKSISEIVKDYDHVISDAGYGTSIIQVYVGADVKVYKVTRTGKVTS